jgi:membrane associated rhomboid family serine protease
MTYIYRVSSNKRNFLKDFSVNAWIILINILFFFGFMLYVLFSKISSSEGLIQLYNYIAINPANIIAGKYLWTFLTSMFMHGSFWHLFANMFSLFFIGSLTQKIIGQKRYLYFYLISGLFASLLFVVLALLFNMDINTYAVGASGAIFGLVGFLMVITPNLPVYVMFIPIPIKMKYAAPGILIVLWLISIAGDIPIGNTAHLGGLITGLFYGIYLKNKYKNKTKAISKHFS